jgi:hypothetical protein
VGCGNLLGDPINFPAQIFLCLSLEELLVSVAEMIIERVLVKLDALHSINTEAILSNLDQCEK